MFCPWNFTQYLFLFVNCPVHICIWHQSILGAWFSVLTLEWICTEWMPWKLFFDDRFSTEWTHWSVWQLHNTVMYHTEIWSLSCWIWKYWINKQQLSDCTALPSFNLTPVKLINLPLLLHICVSELGQHWFRYLLVTYSAPSHYLNQCWVIANWTLSNKLQWNFNHNSKLFIHENASKNIVCEMVAILSRGY